MATVKRIESRGSPALLFSFEEPVNPAPVTQRVPVEGELGDEADTRIHCLLHVVDGTLNELEFFREDGSPIAALSAAERLRVIVNG